LKYLGKEISKPRIGVFDFTGCEGCELQLLNREDTLIDFLSLVEVVNFREASSDRSDEYEIAFVEGAVSRSDEVVRLKEIRRNAKLLVALGTCACFGGVNQLKNKFRLEEVVSEVYGDQGIETEEVRRISDVVRVDFAIPGCPVNKAEVEQIVVDLVTGADPSLPKFPVCVECKQKENICVVDLGEICLGPITRAGCGAICPTGKTGCFGCRGGAPEANFEAFGQIMEERGFSGAAVRERLDFYGGFKGVEV